MKVVLKNVFLKGEKGVNLVQEMKSKGGTWDLRNHVQYMSHVKYTKSGSTPKKTPTNSLPTLYLQMHSLLQVLISFLMHIYWCESQSVWKSHIYCR